MNHPLQLKSLAIGLLTWMTCISAHAEVISRLSSRFIARGEQAVLEVAVIGGRPSELPQVPDVKGVQIRLASDIPRSQLLPGRRIEHVFAFIVTSYETGSHAIPGFPVMINGAPEMTKPVEFTVFNPDELKWQEATTEGSGFRYASAFRILNPNPYEGETIPVEIKLYVPRDLFVADWGIPDFERSGLTAWRFQPSELRSQVNLLGLPYVAVSYPSSITPTRSGPISLGPAKIRLMTTQVVMDGILRRIAVESYANVPRVDLIAQPLPENAPAGFSNAVGEFTMQLSTQQTDVNEGDPIALDITISGSGNLDTIHPPTPVDASGWKLYDTTTEPRGDERREASGTTVFHQFIRPLELKGAIPPYRLVFFNPKTRSYETILSDPIPLQMKPSTTKPSAPTGPPPVATTPVEKMNDILGLIDTPTQTSNPSKPPVTLWIHAVGALIAFGLIVKSLWMRYQNRLAKDDQFTIRHSELKQLESRSLNDYEFLMAAGRFVERWHGNPPSPESHAILDLRDSLCFTPDAAANARLTRERRNTILRTLRKACLAILCLLTLAPSARANEDPDTLARQAYQSAKYDEAITCWLNTAPDSQLSANTLYHIGNAHYRNGSPGKAALYYHRALARDPNHHESRQNLRFLERKYGSITPTHSNLQSAIAKIPLTIWQNTTWIAVWLIVIALLIFPASKAGSTIRIPAILCLLAAPLLTVISGLGWYYSPNHSRFSSLASQAVVLDESAVVHTEASRTSAEVIHAPAGSLCQILHQSGDWSYISLPNDSRGWLPSKEVEKVER